MLLFDHRISDIVTYFLHIRLGTLSNVSYLFILFGVLRRFQHCTGHITTGSWKGRGNQYIEFIRVLYCKLPTNGKQLPAFPLEAMTGIEPRPQRWEVRVLPLCHRGPCNVSYKFDKKIQIYSGKVILLFTWLFHNGFQRQHLKCLIHLNFTSETLI